MCLCVVFRIGGWGGVVDCGYCILVCGYVGYGCGFVSCVLPLLFWVLLVLICFEFVGLTLGVLL